MITAGTHGWLDAHAENVSRSCSIDQSEVGSTKIVPGGSSGPFPSGSGAGEGSSGRNTRKAMPTSGDVSQVKSNGGAAVGADLPALESGWRFQTTGEFPTCQSPRCRASTISSGLKRPRLGTPPRRPWPPPARFNRVLPGNAPRPASLSLLLSFSLSLFLSFGASGIRVGTVDQAGLEIEFPQAETDRRRGMSELRTIVLPEQPPEPQTVTISTETPGRSFHRGPCDT
jgi:hypothetical protein